MKKAPSFLAALLLISAIFLSFNSIASSAEQARFGDWEVTCIENNCRLAQGLKNPDNPGIVFGLLIVNIKGSDVPVAQLNFPLGIYLPASIGILVAEEKVEIPMTTCLPKGCIALLPLNDSLIKAMQTQPEFNVRFYVNEKTPREISFSLKGFSEAYEIFSKN